MPITLSSHVDRRNFLKIGSLGAGLSLAGGESFAEPLQNKGKSVIWIWLSGGATHVETFDPKPLAPIEFRSTVGSVSTKIPGYEIGGLFPKIGQVADKFAFVHSFSHGNSGHAGGTHYVMTGVDNIPADAGLGPVKPSFGSIISRVRGPNSLQTGVPTYVRTSGVYADGADFLGTPFGPFDIGGDGRSNMNLKTSVERLDDRRALLREFDSLEQNIDRKGFMDGVDKFKSQSFLMMLGKAKEAFDLSLEDQDLRSQYNGYRQKHPIGDNLMLARRLCESGAGFISVAYSNAPQGWDMHGDNGQPNMSIEKQLNQACPPLDQALSTLVQDIADRGLSDKIMIVVAGEFGRTPRINANAGRDHWGQLCTLAVSGGGLKMGQVVGESSAKAENPKTKSIHPKDLMATIFHVMDVDPNLQFLDHAGRPQFLLPDGAMPIKELI